MNLDQLLDILDIESLDEFMYFEQFSDFIEYQDEIDYDLFFEVVSGTAPAHLAEMTENYFEDLISGIPDDNMDLYSTLNSERALLTVLAEASDNPREKALYADELFNFRNWYIFKVEVECTCLATDIVRKTNVYDALVLYRLEKLSGDKYDYDFSAVLPYEPDEYALTVADELNALSDFDSDNAFTEQNDYDIIDTYDEDSYDPDREIDPYQEGLIDRDNPVIDGVDYGD